MKSKSLRAKYNARRTEIDESLFGTNLFNEGIKPNRSQRNEEELNKVTKMVKEKNYNHPEIALVK